MSVLSRLRPYSHSLDRIRPIKGRSRRGLGRNDQTRTGDVSGSNSSPNSAPDHLAGEKISLPYCGELDGDAVPTSEESVVLLDDRDALDVRLSSTQQASASITKISVPGKLVMSRSYSSESLAWIEPRTLLPASCMTSSRHPDDFFVIW